jgi:hypothetical protein
VKKYLCKQKYKFLNLCNKHNNFDIIFACRFTCTLASLDLPILWPIMWKKGIWDVTKKKSHSFRQDDASMKPII